MLGPKQIIEMLAMQIEGKSIVQIAEAFNVTKGRGSQILNKDENQQLRQLISVRTFLVQIGSRYGHIAS
jgi:hypothetical protein